MTTAYETRQTGFDEDADLKAEQIVALAQALDAREYAKAEYDRCEDELKTMAGSLPNGIYRVGPWRIVVDSELKTTIRVTRPKGKGR